jgi:aryl-alcohol dehydrogenase-like predicted oxidoreductase
MEYKMLGNSDLKISRIGFGCMSLDPGNPDSELILNMALEAGINYFDTADLYQQGLNESMLGRVFQGKRDRVILATKAGNQWRPDGSGWDWNPSPAYILSCLEQSLVRLNTDYIDLFQLHGGTLDDPIDDIIEVFEKLRKAGKIRHFGISSIRPNVIREYAKCASVVSVMMQYSLLDRRPEESMLTFLNQHQIGVLARGTLAKGFLISKTAEPYLNYTAGQVADLSAAVNSISASGRTAESISIQYVLSHPEVTSAVVGIRTKEQLFKAVSVLSAEPISKMELEKITGRLAPNFYDLHR